MPFVKLVLHSPSYMPRAGLLEGTTELNQLDEFRSCGDGTEA